MNARASGVVGAVLLALVTGLPLPTALAQAPEASSQEDRRQAAKEFASGDRAYKDGDFRLAAESYERAYKRAPHHSALWNAARAWHRAGELARAANLYAWYLREAPPSARDRNSAQRALNDLSSRLARLEIHAAEGVAAIRVDGEPVVASSVFVTPGAHVVEGRTLGDRPVREPQSVAAGDVISISLSPPPPPPAAVAPAPAPVAEAAPAPRSWLPVLYVGGAATLALAGVTVWSGLDTNQQKDAFERAPTQGNLDAGRQKEARTNILIGVSSGVAALTVVTFFVLRASGGHEKAQPSAQLGVGPGAVVLRGVF